MEHLDLFVSFRNIWVDSWNILICLPVSEVWIWRFDFTKTFLGLHNWKELDFTTDCGGCLVLFQHVTSKCRVPGQQIILKSTLVVVDVKSGIKVWNNSVKIRKKKKFVKKPTILNWKKWFQNKPRLHQRASREPQTQAYWDFAVCARRVRFVHTFHFRFFQI